MSGAGQLDRRIRIERATTTTDASGAEIPAWAALATVSAQKLTQRPVEAWRAGGTAATLETAWRIRWSSRVADVGPRDRLVYRDRAYEISGVEEIGRREFLQIIAVADAR
jgi:SPP1 family predicted phage head-tail adaptor